MNIKSLTTAAVAAMFLLGAGGASAEVITLDLTKATTQLKYDPNTGAADVTYVDAIKSIDSQCFRFLHNSMSEDNFWWGFTASNSADNSFKKDFLTYQFSNMAKGGIVLNEDGSVKVDDKGLPTVSADVPYIVGYYSSFYSKRPTDMLFTDTRLYTPVSVYINLSTWGYYAVAGQDSYARGFVKGDTFTLTIHGVAADDTEKTVEVELASFPDTELIAATDWKLVDLSSLGAVKELYFTLDSTDSGEWGMNTPAYFCLDKLAVEPVENSSIESISVQSESDIRYIRGTGTVIINGADFACVYDINGRQVMTVEAQSFSVESLPQGVYIIKAGNKTLKIVK